MPFIQLKDIDHSFPPAYYADSKGMVAVGGQLSVDRVVQAYMHGIYFWFGPMDPLKWWSPDPRLIIKSTSRQNASINHSDGLMMESIDDPRTLLPILRAVQKQENVSELSPHWLTEEMLILYLQLARNKLFRAWRWVEHGNYLGTILGIIIGKAVFLEYIHAPGGRNELTVNDRLIKYLSNHLGKQNIQLIDVQKENIRTRDIEIEQLSRFDYLSLLTNAVMVK